MRKLRDIFWLVRNLSLFDGVSFCVVGNSIFYLGLKVQRYDHEIKVPLNKIWMIRYFGRILKYKLSPIWSSQHTSFAVDGHVISSAPEDTSIFTTVVESFFENEYRLDEVDWSNGVVFDIGANIGDMAISMLSRGARKIYCFEPVPSTYKQLDKNVVQNKMQNQIQIYKFGLSNSNERVTVKVKPYASACASTDSNSLSGRLGMLEEIINLREVSEALTEIGVTNIDLLKIDCEGCEYCISYPKMVEILNPRHIALEYHDGLGGISNILTELGYLVTVEKKTENVGLMYAKKK